MIAGWLETGNAEGSEITVYKSPMCGCCNRWVDHLRDHGFKVMVVNRTDLEGIKAQHGITQEIASCHTALIGDYAVEGHVPAAVIKRLLKERPSVKGIAVPGMPIGSPGMEGGDSQSYDILTFDADGQSAVYSSR